MKYYRATLFCATLAACNVSPNPKDTTTRNAVAETPQASPTVLSQIELIRRAGRNQCPSFHIIVNSNGATSILRNESAESLPRRQTGFDHQSSIAGVINDGAFRALHGSYGRPVIDGVSRRIIITNGETTKEIILYSIIDAPEDQIEAIRVFLKTWRKILNDFDDAAVLCDIRGIRDPTTG